MSPNQYLEDSPDGRGDGKSFTFMKQIQDLDKDNVQLQKQVGELEMEREEWREKYDELQQEYEMLQA